MIPSWVYPLNDYDAVDVKRPKLLVEQFPLQELSEGLEATQIRLGL